MSITEAMGRVAQIQTTIAGFDPTAAARTASSAPSSAQGAASTAATPQTGAAFAQTLASLLAPASSDAAPTSAADAAGPLAAGSAGGVTGDQVAAAAQRYVGVPYVWGGTDPARGMDCSGFVQRVYQDLGISLPRVVHDQMTQGAPVASLADARPGDLLIDFGGEHVAIYLGNGKAIDAPEPGKTIQVRDAWEKYTGLTAIRRIVPDSGAAGAAGPAGVAGGSAPSGVAGLDASQLGYARTIVGEVRARGLPAQAAVNAISTALQESSLRMYWNPKVAGSQALAPDPSAVGADGYSVGLFQQQVNGAQFSWGSVADAMDPRTSTRMFLDRLTAIPGWQGMSVTAADQAVQRSAYPEAYARWEPTARAVVAALYPGAA
ncbi:C40 family peptidase [Sinomonas sp. RB5]